VPSQDYNQTDPAYIIADLNARIRSLENKYNVLTERLLVINQNMIQEYKKLMKELRDTTQDTKKTRMGMLSTQEVVKDMVKEMNIFAKKDEIKVLEKYMDLLNILQLVTDEQLEKRLEKFKIELRG
tara:strand:+ start:1559 stop:1936 length:378 start_codon:yes stop_codon:yes gene_type:complete